MRKNILAISGSTRVKSSNHALIKAIQELTINRFNITFFKDIEGLPHFNPDLDNENPPEKIKAFRE